MSQTGGGGGVQKYPNFADKQYKKFGRGREGGLKSSKILWTSLKPTLSSPISGVSKETKGRQEGKKDPLYLFLFPTNNIHPDPHSLQEDRLYSKNREM